MQGQLPITSTLAGQCPPGSDRINSSFFNLYDAREGMRLSLAMCYLMNPLPGPVLVSAALEGTGSALIEKCLERVLPGS